MGAEALRAEQGTPAAPRRTVWLQGEGEGQTTRLRVTGTRSGRTLSGQVINEMKPTKGLPSGDNLVRITSEQVHFGCWEATVCMGWLWTWEGQNEGCGPIHGRDDCGLDQGTGPGGRERWPMNLCTQGIFVALLHRAKCHSRHCRHSSTQKQKSLHSRDI